MPIHSFSPSRPRQQRGIVLVVALIVLVVMALVGLGMMRQTTSGLSIAGNVAIRQNALSAGDVGTNAAIAWLQTQFANGNAFALNADIPASGYYSTWGSPTDGNPVTLFATAGLTPQSTPVDGTSNQAFFIIHRLCASTGSSTAIGQQCSVNDQSAANGTKGGYPANYGSPGKIDIPPPLYRISSMVIGPKNTVSYTQVIVE